MRPLTPLLALILLLTPILHAQRPRIPLSGPWQLRFDPTDTGETSQWFSAAPTPGWVPTRVPGSFNEEFAAHPLTPDLSDKPRFYKGLAWYRTRFTLPPDPHLDTLLHLSGTVLRQKVWLNGKPLGVSDSPYLDVAYDISPLLVPGPNTLVIAVDNRPLPHGIPDAKWHGWWDDGGLIRPVFLERRPHTRADTHVVTSMLPGGGWQLSLKSEVQHPAGATLSFTLSTAAGLPIWRQHKLLTAADTHPDLATILPDIQPWTPDSPHLYRLLVTTSLGPSPTPTPST